MAAGDSGNSPDRRAARPYTRWWWLAGPFDREGIEAQLRWLRDAGFGGVELAWVEPTWLNLPPTARPDWLSAEWSELAAYAKASATRLGLRCDFTFGSAWPFGGTCVGPESAAQRFFSPSPQRLIGSWESDARDDPRVVDHLSAAALRRYAAAVATAFGPALAGPRSSLFCDSLELETEDMWTAGLWEEFGERFGYRLEPFADRIDEQPAVRYDYRALIADVIVREFYEEFTRVCHSLGASSRVQCHGAPADLLAAYAAVDVPESEAILFDPHFSRIAASAAALAGRPIVSCETFTCLYGFISPQYLGPYRFWRREQVADLKLLADSLFAHGINQIVWHGMPYNRPGGKLEFYASVHVGPDAVFADELPAFNDYLATVSTAMRRGAPYSRLAVVLPLEDNRMRGRLPDELRTPGASHWWELRGAVVPPATECFAPLWISLPFLREAQWAGGRLQVGSIAFAGLYVECEWLEHAALRELLRLAGEGTPIVLAQRPLEPGYRPSDAYQDDLVRLIASPTVVSSLDAAPITPLVDGDDLPWFAAREEDDELLMFFAHPLARGLRYPMGYGQSACDEILERHVTLRYGKAETPLVLRFEPHQSLLVAATADGTTALLDTPYRPPSPRYESRPL
jgi:hypothetical protein